MTRLEKLLILFNWQGGTIHQASEELGKYVSKDLTTVQMLLDMNDAAFDLVCFLYQNKKGVK